MEKKHNNQNQNYEVRQSGINEMALEVDSRLSTRCSPEAPLLSIVDLCSMAKAAA